jgi:UDP-glucose 4-epimerase
MRVLVTGSAGFIGTHLCAALRARGDEVVGCDAREGCDLLDSGEFITERFGDDRGYWCGGWYKKIGPPHPFDGVVHLAAINGTRNFYERPADVLRVGLIGTANVIRWWGGRDAGKPGFFVLASSSEVYAEPTEIPTREHVPLVVPDVRNPRYSYSVSKIAGEAMVHHWLKDRPRAMIVRPHNVYGPGMSEDHVIGRLLAARPGVIVDMQGTGGETRAFCHVSDAVAGILAVVDRGEHGETYNVGDEAGLQTMAQLAWEVSKMRGLMEFSWSDKRSVGSPRLRCPDTTRLRALGWEPRVKLEDGLREMLA